MQYDVVDLKWKLITKKATIFIQKERRKNGYFN